MNRMFQLACAMLFCCTMNVQAQDVPWGDKLKGSGSYDQFEKPQLCGSCHEDFARQWEQSMMSQAYTHSWDEIEYFKLAVPHGKKDPKFDPVQEGCNGCHTPLAFIAGDVPPPKPFSGSRADESVSCDVCHTISGSGEQPPFNFSYTIDPGRTKRGNREGVESPHHLTMKHDFTVSPDLCGSCHNEKNPFGVWVKSTHLEWKEGPYSKEGVRCQDCHMPPAKASNSIMSEEHDNISQHFFTGAHSPARLAGAVEVVIYPDIRELEPGEKLKITVACYNHKVGHKIPSGSVEERQLWLTVTAIDANGKEYHLPVDKKGFEGEEFTISSNELAFQDIGYMMDTPEFKGLSRDALPHEGDRVFRMAYFDPQDRMTIAQWNTARLGTDYRIGPRETKLETYTWKLPDDIPIGKVRIVADLQYRRLIKSVGDYLGVPPEEMKAEFINHAESWFEAVD
ncbi:MAG: multiheme c-type cytochrome [Bacteroidota bacterium]